MTTKQALRKEISWELATVSPTFKTYESLHICEELSKLMKELNVSVVMAYAPLENEVNIDQFIVDCLIQKKIVLFPKVIEGATMQAVQVLSLDEMTPGKYGIQQPSGDEYRNKFIDLIVVPGIAFDHDGNRLGRGKGYYDNFLKKYPESFKIGVWFSTQIVDQVPTQEHDVKMDKVIIPDL